MTAIVEPAYWNARLAELIAEYEVPGASLAFLHEGEVHSFAAGVLNKDTGTPVSTDSLFQIGSVSKVWTATQLMLLAEQGRLTLDTPVVDLLPEFKVADAEVTKTVTVRHLLTHTSGIDGDLFLDTGRGDDCLEKYVAACAELTQNHPIGESFSYCNSGFVIAGRIIERLTGKSWDEALREQICEPLGLTHTWTLPEDVLRFSAATGHVEDGNPTPVWGLPRAMGPAGLICARASDVVAFGRAHLGTELLAAPGAMTAPQVRLPNPYTLAPEWGIGWILDEWAGHRVIMHAGNTIGQSAMLWVMPDTGTVICLLVNGGESGAIQRDLGRELFAALADVEMPELLGPPETPVDVDVAGHVGTYERVGCLSTVSVNDDGKLHLHIEVTGALADISPPMDWDLIPVDATTFVGRREGSPLWDSVVFYELADGSRYVHMGVRATPKTA
ncbi:serine hydrolase domain-containing protein [Embleya scabrispora]|uniref:serine hydrolase domain-containing protein n=1 Tax=Embleya scabrispora TaxID=159449 RepID=UPI0003808F01|nr:serine hydrolase domain-containing protein [Embleya scabrispora]MYS78723.1 serine hydrolase [Streptomyces sp. SID5474]